MLCVTDGFEQYWLVTMLIVYGGVAMALSLWMFGTVSDQSYNYCLIKDNQRMCNCAISWYSMVIHVNQVLVILDYLGHMTMVLILLIMLCT